MSYRHSPQYRHKTGFTLIELSIVLVIIGLIVGGVLAGKDLIDAAKLRSQIGQIEQYNAATAAFRNKYNAYPGDMGGAKAATFGFRARTSDAYYFNEDRAYWRGGAGNDGSSFFTSGQETAMFWVDMAMSGLIAANTTAYKSSDPDEWYLPSMTSGLENYFAPAKLTGNYIQILTGYPGRGDGSNWFSVIGLYGISGNQGGLLIKPQITALQAYTIDAKIDDGLPLSGSVQGSSIIDFLPWGNFLWDTTPGATACTVSASPSDKYNITYDAPACALSFKASGLPR